MLKKYVWLIAPIAVFFLLKKNSNLNLSTSCLNYEDLVSKYRGPVTENNLSSVPLSFVLAMIFTESCGDPKAVGDNGKSLGLMQLQKGAWQDSGVGYDYSQSNAFDPVINIKAGTGYLKWIKAQGISDVDNIVMCYNIGITNFVNGRLKSRGDDYLATVKKHRNKIIPYLA